MFVPPPARSRVVHPLSAPQSAILEWGARRFRDAPRSPPTASRSVSRVTAVRAPSHQQRLEAHMDCAQRDKPPLVCRPQIA